jgi:hypothetical protein
MRATFMLVFCACLLASGASAKAEPQVADHSEVEKLGAFAGEWVASGEMKDTPYSKAKIKSHDEMSCQWTPNHGFMICDQTIHTSAGTNNELSIYTYNPQEHAFAFFGLSRNDKEARTTKLTIENNLWTYWDEEEDGGKRVRFRTTNQFTSPTKVTWRSEYSEDGSHWVLMGEGTDSRVR